MLEIAKCLEMFALVFILFLLYMMSWGFVDTVYGSVMLMRKRRKLHEKRQPKLDSGRTKSTLD